jgi:cytidylate kinase
MSIITISRGSLAATEMIAKKVSEKLNCTVVTREDVIEAAEEYGIKETGLGDMSFIDKAPSFWHKISDLRKQYLICFQTALFDFALKGNLVYHGHLAQLLLHKIPFVLRVLLTAPPEFRIKTLMKEKGMTKEQASDHIKLIDERRKKWSQFLYGVDWKDPAHYDIVYNIEKMSVDLIADLITNVVSREEYQLNEESIQTLKNLHLASKAQAYLLKSPRTRGSEVKIEADVTTGTLVVTGTVPKMGSGIWESDIKHVLSEVEGVKTVKIIKSVLGYYETITMETL